MTERTKHSVKYPILSSPFVFDKGPSKSYWEYPSDHSMEEISAALARVEEILRCMGYKLPTCSELERPEGITEIPDSSLEILENLLALMKREPALHLYLDAHRGDEGNPANPLRAWAAAKGDAIFLRTMKESGWASFFSRFGTSLVIPILLIGLTAFLGNSIATALQREAFKHQRTFDVRLAGLQKGQDRAAELYTSINEVYSTIADAEDLKFTGLNTQKLRAERDKLDSIHAASRLYDKDGAVGRTMKEAETILDNYIICLDEKRQAEQKQIGKSTNINCSRQYQDILVKFDRILDAHTLSMDQLVRQP